jgi:hypothetical protein
LITPVLYDHEKHEEACNDRMQKIQALRLVRSEDFRQWKLNFAEQKHLVSMDLRLLKKLLLRFEPCRKKLGDKRCTYLCQLGCQ